MVIHSLVLQRPMSVTKFVDSTYSIDSSRGSIGQPGPPGDIIIICWTGILNLCGPTKYCGPPAIGGPDGSWAAGTDGCGPSEAAAEGLAAVGLPVVSSVTNDAPAPLLVQLSTHYDQHTISRHGTSQNCSRQILNIKSVLWKFAEIHGTKAGVFID